MNLKTLSSTGLLLGGLGVFAIAQNQGARPVGPNVIPTASALMTMATISADPIAAPKVDSKLYRKQDFSDPLSSKWTERTTDVFLKVTLPDAVKGGKGVLEIVAIDAAKNLRVQVGRLEFSAPIAALEVPVNLTDLGRIDGKGDFELRALFRNTDAKISSPESTDKADIRVVSTGTPPTLTKLYSEKTDDKGQKQSTEITKPFFDMQNIKLDIDYRSAEIGGDSNAAVIIVEIDGTKITEQDVKPAAGSTRTLSVDLPSSALERFANAGTKLIRARWESKASDYHPKSQSSVNGLKIEIDTKGPEIDHVRLVGEPGAANTLLVTFRDDDLDLKSAENIKNYSIKRLGTSGSAAAILGTKLSVTRNVVQIPLENLVTGQYELTIAAKAAEGENANVSPLRDSAGNFIGGKGLDGKSQTATFSSYPVPDDAKTGKHIAFPEYTKRPQRKENEIFNPGDKVETRVARLYYIRDAHRVAQIINRNVQSYNRAAVKMNERIAEDARNTANDKTKERREKERAAIRAAQATREEESKLNSLRQELEQSRAVFAQKIQEERAADAAITKYETDEAPADEDALAKTNDKIAETKTAIAKTDEEIAVLETDINDPNKATMKAENQKKKLEKQTSRSALNVNLKSLNATKVSLEKKRQSLDDQKAKIANEKSLAQQNVRSVANKLAQQEQNVAAKRKSEQEAQETSDQSQEAEDRAREDQFRKEVASATTDPDTYVPGDVDSEDPVTQVSVSVIGEGVLQLRGPIRGINKIRTMINQIDAPLGQVKVGIFTVQVNGEHGDRMEKVATRIEGHIDLSRFLTNQSLGYLRRAIQEVAGAVVANVDAQFPGQYRQIDRDRKYLYAFFGRDFVDELYEMDSEFLHTENKLLSLHGMDTVSQSQACFIMALSKNDIRQQILDRFRCLVECDLPQAEWDYRKTSSLLPCKLNSQKEVFRNACEKYKFRNVHGFFEASVYGPDTMTPMQREFIRLAQIFKSQMVAEVELKQRVIERGLIEDRSNTESQRDVIQTEIQNEALIKVREAWIEYVRHAADSFLADTKDASAKKSLDALPLTINRFQTATQQVTSLLNEAKDGLKKTPGNAVSLSVRNLQLQIHPLIDSLNDPQIIQPTLISEIVRNQKDIANKSPKQNDVERDDQEAYFDAVDSVMSKLLPNVKVNLKSWFVIVRKVDSYLSTLRSSPTDPEKIEGAFEDLIAKMAEQFPDPEDRPLAYSAIVSEASKIRAMATAPNERIRLAEQIAKLTRRDIDHRKILEHLIDEQEEKCIELAEGTRSHIAQIDNYLKRLAIALEDDFKVQFYDPAFAGVRAASREWDVNLGQVERTTILTNNRQFAKVEPQATMEFDLPKRAPMIVEGMNGARALVQEYGTLLQDPTFLSLAGMMSGAPAVGGAASGITGGANSGLRNAAVRNVLPGQSTDTGEQLMAQSGGPDRKFGTALEGLIPDPAIYKFETGTGFEIRPVIQPDGHSIIYDFDYMYTTNVREPVRPDEKHLGRVKRHFIHTQVQTSSFELREISRYQVALKASRTSRGVPLLEDIPGAGVLFRPLPSDESSLQQNIILGQSTVYPTLFDLMGLRWSKYVVDLDHINLRDLEHVTRGREQAIRDFTFDEASKRVDDFLDIENKHNEHLRPDLYHQQRKPSPYHPGGYHYVPKPPVKDPHNHSFTIPDRRPEEYRTPSYDPLRRNPVNHELRQIPTEGGQPEDVDLRLPPPEVVPVPPVPTTKSSSGAKRKPTPAPETIQPASYEVTKPQPTVSVDTNGVVRASSSVPDQPSPSIPVKKKSWFSRIATPKNK